MIKLIEHFVKFITVAILALLVTSCKYKVDLGENSITGNGNASKEQVLKMLQRLLNFKDDPKYLDASDALAVAVCHYFQENSVMSTMGSKVNGWDDFLKKNPARLKK